MRPFDFVRLTFIGLAVLLGTFMLIRILPAVRFILFFVLIALLVVIVFVLLKRQREEQAAERYEKGSTEGQIQQHIANCSSQIERLQQELGQIQNSIKDLEQKLGKGKEVAPSVRQKSDAVLAGFRQELDLRKTKINFYRQCVSKLKKILSQHELLSTVEQKKAELDQLRQKHYDEIADMEQLRLEVEHEYTYLDTIQDLSTRMERSSGADEVLHLQKELEKMLAE